MLVLWYGNRLASRFSESIVAAAVSGGIHYIPKRFQSLSPLLKPEVFALGFPGGWNGIHTFPVRIPSQPPGKSVAEGRLSRPL